LRRTSEPILNVPGVITALVLVFAATQLLRDFVLGEVGLLWDFALIPARFAHPFGYDPVAALTERLALDPSDQELAQRLALGREIVAEGDLKPWTLLTYAFLHGGWLHLGLNSVWLLAFGSAVARRFGTARFLGLFAVTAIAGALAHLATHGEDVVPMVGASAAVSGCMAAAIRFVFQPGAPLGVFRLDDEVAYRLPALRLQEVLMDRRVVSFLLVWFGLNLLTGLAGSGLGLGDANIAWQAHIGGFLAGLFLFPLFDGSHAGPSRG
jgi:membrane associated rhomboid family serine protease